MIKYLYYYIWLLNAKLSFYIGKCVFWLRIKIRNTPLELRKLDNDKIKFRNKELNTNSFDFPDGITHWHTFSFTLVFVMIFIFFIPLFTTDFFGNYIVPTTITTAVYLICLACILWYWVYIKKSNKEWLKKKIDKKKKDFYIK